MSIIAFEGINGAGKTTAAKSVAKKLGMEYARLPGHVEIPECVEIRKTLQNDLNPYTRLTLCIKDMRFFYEWAEKQNSDILVDRSFISTCVYQGLDFTPEIIHDITKDFYVDCAILFVCDPIVASQRTAKRKSQTLAGYANQPVGFYSNLQDRYEYEFYRLHHSMLSTVIDTTNKNEQEVADEAVFYIKELQNEGII